MGQKPKGMRSTASARAISKMGQKKITSVTTQKKVASVPTKKKPA